MSKNYFLIDKVKDTFAIAHEKVEQDSKFSMGSLDIDSLFTNFSFYFLLILISVKAADLSKIEFKELLSLATKESYFIVHGKLYKQVNGVATGSPLGG